MAGLSEKLIKNDNLFRIFLSFFKLKRWQLLLGTFISAEIITFIMNSIQSFIWWGYWSSDLIIMGTIDAFVVVVFVAPVLIFLSVQNSRYEDLKKLADEALIKAGSIESEKRFKHYIENAQDVISVIDVGGFVVYESPSIKRVYGYDQTELLGRNIFELIHPDDKKTAIEVFLDNVAKPESVANLELRFMKKDKTWAYIKVAGKNMLNDPLVNGIIINSTDISEKKTMMEELTVAKDKAEKSNRLKSEFLAQMSHEIRSPLSTILSATNLIKYDLDDSCPEKVSGDLRDCFSSINSSGKRIIRTIDMILNMSEMQLGTYEPNWKKVDIYNDVLVQIADEYSTAANSKKLKIDLVNKTEDAVIFCDMYSITQVFANLVDNAIKYSEEGTIQLILENDKSGNIMVKVKDSGIGISPDYLPRIFEPFSQEEQGYTRKYEGNGLGLALVKKYCDLNNAVISVESVKGKGTTFTVKLNKKISLIDK